MQTTPQAVIFDIGNVLITWNPERLFDEIMGSAARRKELFATVDLHGMNDRIDLGAPFRETIYAEAEKHPEFRDQIRLWHDRWADMAQPAITPCWDLLRKLRSAGIPVFALSNFGIDSFAFAETLYPELAEFDRRFISGHLGIMKPDPRIYEIVERDSGLRGSALYFIDDRENNIAAAKARDWGAHLFSDPAALTRDLRALGLPV